MNDLNFNPFPTLRTESLVMRQLKKSDDRLIFEYQYDKENFKYVDMSIYTSIEDAQNYIVKMKTGVDNSKWIIWAI